MKPKILFVDDEENILNAFKRNLRKHFEVVTAVGSIEGLKVIEQSQEFSVVVSDYQMPDMNGVEFLIEVKKKNPDTVRVMLTGQADMNAAVEAINFGNIFRFLNKPCDNDLLIQTLNICIRQYELITAEKTLLNRTLKGSVSMLLDVLNVMRPDIFSKSSRVKNILIQVYRVLNIPRSWSVELAAMIYYIGLISLDDDLINKVCNGKSLSDDEKTDLAESENLRKNLLDNIPRLDMVNAVIINSQLEPDEQTFAVRIADMDRFVLGGQILSIALDYESLLVSSTVSESEIVVSLKKSNKKYNPQLLEEFNKIKVFSEKGVSKEYSIQELICNLVLDDDVYATNGQLLITKGQEITEPLLLRLKNLSRKEKVQEPIRAHRPEKN